MFKTIYSLISVIVELIGFLSNLGISCKALNVESNHFGTFMITSVGGTSFKINDGYAPLISFLQVVGICAICSTEKKTYINKEKQKITEEYTNLNFTLDHRYVDGALCSKVIKYILEIADNPQILNE